MMQATRPRFPDYDLSDEAWEEAERKAQGKLDREMDAGFIEGMEMTAKCVRYLLPDGQETSADWVIRKLCDEQVSGHAAVIMQREYSRFLSAPHDVGVDSYILFFVRLGQAWVAAGI
jgi:hypothetical protein